MTMEVVNIFPHFLRIIIIISANVIAFLLVSESHSFASAQAQDSFKPIVVYDSNSFWNDSEKSCVSTFSCGEDPTTGWNDTRSLRLSTTKDTEGSWSSITGGEINGTAGGAYRLLSHIRLNNWAHQSHVTF